MAERANIYGTFITQKGTHLQFIIYPDDFIEVWAERVENDVLKKQDRKPTKELQAYILDKYGIKVR